jgi:uncharacterized protein (DUF924 family)
MVATDVIKFWFEETDRKNHFASGPDFDALIRHRFLALHQAAARGELFTWRDNAIGALAEIIILDQFSRNIFRNKADAFAFDALALVLAQQSVAKGHDRQLEIAQRSFLYMPYMHSESRLIHIEAERLFAQPGLEGNYGFELRHKAIIDRFGRYPHRNAILQRPSSEEELQFLQQADSSFWALTKREILL